VRAFRESRRRAGAKARKLSDDRTRDELAVIFGPEMSAKRAAITLRQLTDKIEEEELLPGRDEAGDYVVETVDGKQCS
jgi:hypothetical protein